MGPINTMRSGSIRYKPKFLRTRARDWKIKDIDSPILADPSSIKYVGSQLFDKVNKTGTRSQSPVILIGDAMLIRASAINDSNRELLTNTLRRQHKTWELITVDGESFLKVISYGSVAVPEAR